MKICIDPGHGGTDIGAIGEQPFRLEEKDFNLSLALLLEEELEKRDHWVVVTRRRDRTLGLAPEANFANRLEADIFISVHANAASSPAVEGMEVYHFPGSSAGQVLANAVLESMIASFPSHNNRGVKEANFAVLRLTAMPAMVIETEFLTNPNQLRFLADPATQHRIAVAIANASDVFANTLHRPATELVAPVTIDKRVLP